MSLLVSGRFHSGYGCPLHCWIKDGNAFETFFHFEKTFVNSVLMAIACVFYEFLKVIEQTLLFFFKEIKRYYYCSASYSKLTKPINQYTSVNKMTW